MLFVKYYVRHHHDHPQQTEAFRSAHQLIAYLTFFIFVEGVETKRQLGATAVADAVTTVAGNSTKGYSGDKGLATAAQLNGPFGVTVDLKGNIYVADTRNSVIRLVNVDTNIITTVAGYATDVGDNEYGGLIGDGGPATAAELYNPTGVAVDTAGNIYIADTGNHLIRKVTRSTGYLTTLAGDIVRGSESQKDFGNNGYYGDGGPATKAILSNPNGLAIGLTGNIYIADTNNNVIRMVDISTNNITTVAGTALFATYYYSEDSGYSGDNGPATEARLTKPKGIAIDTAGNIYIADSGNNVIRMISRCIGHITTVAGNGIQGYSGDGYPAQNATMSGPTSVAVDAEGNIYIADTGNNVIRVVASSTGIITTLATNVRAYGIAIDRKGHVYIPDLWGNAIKMITLAAPTSTP